MITKMKKMFLALITLLTVTVSASAMSYEQARSEALFLTDKMAYELNLTDEQYEAAYEINLDYLMGVTGRADVFGTYWERRNLDLSYILLDWQWQAFIAASYFYRPLYWEAGYWHFGIYSRYPHRDYFFFGRPHFYVTYRGGHSWHMNGGHSFYYGRRHTYRVADRKHFGMHDRWNRGDFRGPRHSSTRITGHDRKRDHEMHNRGLEHRRNNEIRRDNSQMRDHQHADRGHTINRNHEHNGVRDNQSFNNNRNNGSFRGNRENNTVGRSRGGSFGSSRNNSSFGSSRNNSSFGSTRSSSSFGGSRNSSFGSSRSSTRSSGSFSGGSHGGSHSGGHGGSHGGGHSGGRR